MLQNPILRGLFVFAFMMLVTVQAATGFLYSGGLRPRAVIALDGLVETLFFAPFGQFGGIVVLTCLSVFLAMIAYWRGVSEAAR